MRDASVHARFRNRCVPGDGAHARSVPGRVDRLQGARGARPHLSRGCQRGPGEGGRVARSSRQTGPAAVFRVQHGEMVEERGAVLQEPRRGHVLHQVPSEDHSRDVQLYAVLFRPVQR